MKLQSRLHYWKQLPTSVDMKIFQALKNGWMVNLPNETHVKAILGTQDHLQFGYGSTVSDLENRVILKELPGLPHAGHPLLRISDWSNPQSLRFSVTRSFKSNVKELDQ